MAEIENTTISQRDYLRWFIWVHMLERDNSYSPYTPTLYQLMAYLAEEWKVP